MTSTAKAQEPSMEEILASIRRIIADEPAAKPAEPPRPAPAPKPAAKAPPPPPPPPAAGNSQDDIDAMLAGFDSAPADADVLDLTPDMEAQPGFRTIDGESDLVFREIEEPKPAPRPAARAPAPRPAAPPVSDDDGEPLMSNGTHQMVTSAFGSLAHTIMMNNSKTLDDIVKEMLRPMLKSWLDDNLPALVERLVRAEIERVSRGRS